MCARKKRHPVLLLFVERNVFVLSDKRICGYTVYKTQSELPFHVELVDHDTGEARVILDDGYTLDYERRNKYTFEIAPHDCATGKHADR